jgi:hypothetical protein
MLTPYAALVISREIMDHRQRVAERDRLFRSSLRFGRRGGRGRPFIHEEINRVSR